MVEINISEFSHIDGLDMNRCWIDHILFSQKIMILFFYYVLNLIIQTFYHIYFILILKKKIHNIIDTGMAGHGSWYDENNFIIWGRQKQLTKKINKIDNSILKNIIKLIRFIGVPSFVRKNLYGDNYINFNKQNKSAKNLNLKFLII